MPFGRLDTSASSAPRGGAARPIGEINMTPLIDVMLVLLVIFMIAAPLMAPSLRLDLPRAAAARPSDAPRHVVVAVDATGALHWGDEPLTPERLRERLREAARRDPAVEVQLRADRTVAYGRIAEVVGWVHEAGLRRIGFVAEGGR